MIRTVRERLVYENVYVRVFDDDVEFPGGTRGTYFRTRWKAPFGVGIVAIRRGHALLIRTWRYGEGAWSLEIPQGFGVEGLSPEVCAAKELAEETGLKAGACQFLLTHGREYPTHIFIAQLEQDAQPTSRLAERSEVISDYVWLEIASIHPARFGELGLFDPGTIAALMCAQATG